MYRFNYIGDISCESAYNGELRESHLSKAGEIRHWILHVNIEIGITKVN